MPAVIKGKGIYGFVDATGLFSRGHTVYDWHAKIGAETKALAVIEAPARTGAMKASIYFSMPDHLRGPRSKFLEVKVGARRKYSRFVHEGTTGPITSNSGKRMGPMSFPSGVGGFSQPLSGNPFKSASMGGTKVGLRLSGASEFVPFGTYQYSVSGQAANPFLARALDIVARKHRWRSGRTRIF